MLSRILQFRPVVARACVGVRRTNWVRTNSTTTSPIFTIPQSEAKVKGVWGAIERYHAKRLINVSTPLLAPDFMELDVKRGPDVGILIDNIESDKKVNVAISSVCSIGTALGFLYCCGVYMPDFYQILTNYASSNWLVWVVIYYNDVRSWQNQRLLNSVKKNL